ncbi:MAG: helix-turn-helix domain-containing protein [Serratia sp. (in: enterobacteria)]|uniref:winged helix-turn-helix transcriptional regulator n=1 Tax=Serratia sp. (in: enterobacteria) TaxID=616 RepID=UPI003F33311A
MNVSELHIKPINLPSPYISKLLQSLEGQANPQVFTEGTVLPFVVEGVAMCYLIHEGIVGFYREADEKLLVAMQAATILGIADNDDDSTRQFRLQPLTPCKITPLTLNTVYEVIRQKALWETLARHLNAVVFKLIQSSIQLSAPSAYEIMRYQLMELMVEPDEVRLRMTAERYIRYKTNLSRSGIMRILSNLKTGGYIEIEEGKLMKINKLPAKY